MAREVDDEDVGDEGDLDREGPDEADLAGSGEDSAETETCPYCGESVYEGAERCPHCGQYISAEDDPHARRKTQFLIIAVVCMIIILVSWVLMNQG